TLSLREPIVLSVDDVHWADEPSLRFLTHVTAHLDELRVVLLLAARPLEDTCRSPALERLCGDQALPRVVPRLLSNRGVHNIVASRLENAPPQLPLVLHDVTGGNPFFLTALLDDIELDASHPARVDPGQARQAAPVSVSRSVLMRLAGLSQQAVRLASAVAVLGDDQPFVDAATLSRLDMTEAATVHDALVRASILRPAPRPTFVHPIVRSAVYADLGPRQRAAWHAKAAEILAANGRAGARVALHLLPSDPIGDTKRVDALRGAALDAMRHGAPEIAARFLSRALNEPPPRALRAEVLLELGLAETLSVDPRCAEHLRSAIEESEDPVVRAQAALALGRVLAFNQQIVPAVEIMRKAADDLWQSASDLVLIVESELLNTALIDGRTARLAHARAHRLRARVRTRSGGVEARHALSFLASLGALVGEPPDAVARLAEQALAGGPVTGPESPVAHLAPFALIFSDRYAPAAQALQALVDDAQQRGSVAGFVLARTVRAHLNYRRGLLVDAEADARDALAAGLELPLATLPAAAFLADVLLERGDLNEALELVSVDVGPEGAGVLTHFLHTRGRVLLAHGRPDAAVSALLDCGRRLEATGVRNPAVVPWRSAAAEALMAGGHRAQAGKLALEELELARALSAPRGIGIALMAAGRCHQGEDGQRLLSEALTVLAGSDSKLEHARALIYLGSAMRRANQRSAAREPLRTGLDLAMRAGAIALANQATVELKATGARPRRALLSGVASLTASELRVAKLAASGMTRPQIARALFVTPKTIDAHLAHTYQKLGIRSRDDLARLIDRTDRLSTDDPHPGPKADR
ncbi:MAG: hypothetical protein QOG59_3708, partial [Solirubrobacteraceae bacterium]|nr:hypothetical protein [Solirubrobacteraceae bacterium]